jgi:hypothetical protein
MRNFAIAAACVLGLPACQTTSRNSGAPSTGTIAGAVASIPTDIGQACSSAQQSRCPAQPAPRLGSARSRSRSPSWARRCPCCRHRCRHPTARAGLLLPIGVERDECKGIFEPIAQVRLGSRRECADLLMPDMGPFDLACLSLP